MENPGMECTNRRPCPGPAVFTTMGNSAESQEIYGVIWFYRVLYGFIWCFMVFYMSENVPKVWWCFHRLGFLRASSITKEQRGLESCFGHTERDASWRGCTRFETLPTASHGICGIWHTQMAPPTPHFVAILEYTMKRIAFLGPIMIPHIFACSTSWNLQLRFPILVQFAANHLWYMWSFHKWGTSIAGKEWKIPMKNGWRQWLFPFQVSPSQSMGWGRCHLCPGSPSMLSSVLVVRQRDG